MERSAGGGIRRRREMIGAAEIREEIRDALVVDIGVSISSSTRAEDLCSRFYLLVLG